MPHPEYWVLIEARADEQLTGEELERLELHLRTCEDCTARLTGASREATAVRTALAPTEPVVDVSRLVMSRIERRPSSVKQRLRPGLLAGVAANLVTAGLLVLLSLGVPVPLILIIAVALAIAIVWGGLKGLVFGWMLRFLPRGILPRGLLFGGGVWIVTSVLFTILGGLSSTVQASPGFVLAGSLVHDLLYGVLLSWFYSYVTHDPDGWWSVPGRSRGRVPARIGLSLLIAFGMLAGALITPRTAGARGNERPPARAATPTTAPSPTSVATADAAPTPTASATPAVSPTPAPPATAAVTPRTAATATATPTAKLSATPVARRTGLATPAPRPRRTPAVTSHHHHVARSAARSPIAQVRSVLPDFLAPHGKRTPVQRARDIIVLLNFL